MDLYITAPSSSNNSKGMDHLAKSPRLHVPENGKLARSSFDRICSHEMLQDCEPNSPYNKLKRKVIYLLVPPLVGIQVNAGNV